MRIIDWEATAANLKELRRRNLPLRKKACYCKKSKLDPRAKDGCKVDFACENCGIGDIEEAISQAELAALFYCDANTIANYENGRVCLSVEVLFKYSEICELPMEKILILKEI